MSREIVEALRLLEEEKGIDFKVLLAALEDALLSAYKKTPDAVQHARVEIDPDDGEIRIYELILPERPAAAIAAEAEAGEAGGTAEAEAGAEATAEAGAAEAAAAEEEKEEEEFDLSMYDESEIEKVPIETPEDFGRIAAQTAKQVIFQRIREAERDMMYDEYAGRVGEIITGIVQQSDQRYTLVDLGKVEALLPESEQVDHERYDHGSRIKAVIVDVREHTKGPQVIVSRRSDELIRKLFELEVPEVADGLVVIRNVAREPGFRSKIAVESKEDGIDPVGACVGPRGSRVRMVVSELRGEKIDIIPYNDEPARFVAKALSPAMVREVLVDDEEKSATVVVPDDQLSLAIGKEGQNARLANKLTGWRIDIKSESQMSEEESAMVFSDEEAEELAGRCCALTKGGKRCPNAALPGSRFCGIPSHQKLAEEEAAAALAGEEAEAGDESGGEAEAGNESGGEAADDSTAETSSAEETAADGGTEGSGGSGTDAARSEAAKSGS
ncbi:MAG: transcription termination factor NusA [Actinobacteria bacterium]|nr:transcription termination factor NusA [Actinomycetota bacterium]MCL6092512.1 transcription termination factor NusA [Actinomycetota bacterium]